MEWLFCGIWLMVSVFTLSMLGLLSTHSRSRIWRARISLRIWRLTSRLRLMPPLVVVTLTRKRYILFISNVFIYQLIIDWNFIDSIFTIARFYYLYSIMNCYLGLNWSLLIMHLRLKCYLSRFLLYVHFLNICLLFHSIVIWKLVVFCLKFWPLV